jgi:DNA-binding transcriptional LysR family regulator
LSQRNSDNLIAVLLCFCRSDRLFPDVQLFLSEMDSTAQIEQIAGHRIDLGFIGLGLPKDNPELEFVAVAEERLVAVIPQDHRLAHKSRRAIPLKALAAEPGTATAPHACGTTATRALAHFIGIACEVGARKSVL